jgi:hypothetical protein
MTLAPIETTGRRSGVARSRVLLNCDKSGCWTVTKQNGHRRQFPNFDTALDSVRNAANRNAPAIEVWQDGEYICCLQPKEQPYRSTAATLGRPLPQAHVLLTAERYANRVAEILLMTAGPLFWAVLVLLVLAGSLGWRLAVL